MKIPTLERIEALEVGSSMIAYIGNFEQDIARCEKVSSQDRGAPAYKRLLSGFYDELKHLQIKGIIELTKTLRKANRPDEGRELIWTEYVYQAKKLVS